MGVYDDIDEDDDTDYDQAPARDNNVLRDLRKALKASESRAKQLEEQLGTLSKDSRDRAISDVLKRKGLTNPKIATLIPKDLEPTAEAVSTWLEEYADVFGAAGPPESDDAEPKLPEGAADALRDIDEVGLGGLDQRSAADLETKIRNAGSIDELQALFRGMAG
jgi:hypothetical protein